MSKKRRNSHRSLEARESSRRVGLFSLVNTLENLSMRANALIELDLADQIYCAAWHGVGCDNSAEPLRAALRQPRLGHIVHVHQSEAQPVAGCPLEVVHKRPHDVTVQRYSIFDGARRGAEMPVL